MQRTYLILDATEIDKIDFSQVVETSRETLRFNLNFSKTIISWKETIPSFISEITTAEGPYLLDEIKQILLGDEWLSKQNYI